MSRYLRWSRIERRESTRIAITLLAGPVFLGLLPALVVSVAPRIDSRYRLPQLGIGAAARILGGCLAAAGFSLGFWSVQAQLDRGRGTPLPLAPTQVLLTDGPFRYCRNPMTLGAIVGYLGLAVVARTPTGIVLGLSFGALLLAYLKGLEEGELAERFGEGYLRYEETTPFLIPHRPRQPQGAPTAITRRA